MEALKLGVERIVHPIPALDLSKNKFRRELYAHAYQQYEQLRERGHDCESAVSRSLERLGDPEQLRDEFTNTISRTEQWSYRIETHTGSDRLRAIAVLTVPVFFVSAMLGFGPILLLGILKGFEHEAVATASWVVLAIYIYTMCNYASFVWLTPPIKKVLRVEATAWKKLAMIAAIHVICFTGISVLLLLGLQGILVHFRYPNHEILWLVRYCGPALMFFEEFTALPTIFYALIRECATDERIPDWPYS